MYIKGAALNKRAREFIRIRGKTEASNGEIRLRIVGWGLRFNYSVLILSGREKKNLHVLK